MKVDLAIVKISLKFNEEIVNELKELSKKNGFEVKYLCHDKIPFYYVNDDVVVGSYLRMSASRSRNLLYRKIQSSRVLFLDEDATLSAAAVKFLVDFIPKNQRCSIIFSGKRNILKKKILRMNDWNFYLINKFYCEWNTVYDKTLIKGHRLFPGIGVGSRHEFWSGEGICSLLNIKSNSPVYLRPESVSHPSLSASKDFYTASKYIKGYGFTMAYVYKRGSKLLKIITLIRFMSSIFRDILLPHRIAPSVENLNIYLYGIYSLIWKLEGFIGWKR